MQIIVVMLELYCLITVILILLVRLVWDENSFEFDVYASVKRGDRIAQLICEKIEMADLVEEEVCI